MRTQRWDILHYGYAAECLDYQLDLVTSAYEETQRRSEVLEVEVSYANTCQGMFVN